MKNKRDGSKDGPSSVACSKEKSDKPFHKNSLIERINYQPQNNKFKSLFDKEGNPFKYFKDIKKHLKSDASILQYYFSNLGIQKSSI